MKLEQIIIVIESFECHESFSDYYYYSIKMAINGYMSIYGYNNFKIANPEGPNLKTEH